MPRKENEMSRGVKRAAQIDESVCWRAHDIPKSEWTEMYFDLYRQVFGEDSTDETIMQDAEKRRLLLFGKAPKKRPTPRTAAFTEVNW
jgi:hypothetical protein